MSLINLLRTARTAIPTFHIRKGYCRIQDRTFRTLAKGVSQSQILPEENRVEHEYYERLINSDRHTQI